MEYKEEIETLGEICSRLYSKINDGKKPTVAVTEVAEENYFNNVKPSSLSSIWRYYIKLKKNIE